MYVYTYNIQCIDADPKVSIYVLNYIGIDHYQQ